MYFTTIIFELILLGYVWLFGLRPKGKRLRDLIGGKWARADDVVIDIGVAMLFWMVVITVLVILSLLLGRNSVGLKAIKTLLPQGAIELALWVLLSATAGFCEEVVFRGYLQRQFLALTRNVPAAVACQAILFGAVHGYQGVKGAITITIYGALFGILAVLRKSLRPGMIQHAGQDILAGVLGSILSKYKYI